MLKKKSCVILYIFSFKFKVHTQILKYLKEINHEQRDKNFATMVCFIFQVCWEDLSGRNHICFVFKCLHTDLLWWVGGANSLVLILLPYDVFWRCLGDRFTAAEVFHQHANTDIPVKVITNFIVMGLLNSPTTISLVSSKITTVAVLAISRLWHDAGFRNQRINFVRH